jgi:hypothetical protein
MSLVCYLRKERKKGRGVDGPIQRKLYTNEHDKYWCKDWYDALPHVITFESEVGVAKKIVGLIQGSGNSPTEAKSRAAKTTPPKKRTTTRKKVG